MKEYAVGSISHRQFLNKILIGLKTKKSKIIQKLSIKIVWFNFSIELHIRMSC